MHTLPQNKLYFIPLRCIMRDLIKKYGSLFLLLAFLFPLVQKELHALEHSDESQCSTTTEKHFHAEEHHCDICDFALPSLDETIAETLSIQLAISTLAYTTPHAEDIFLSPSLNIPARAPPVK